MDVLPVSRSSSIAPLAYIILVSLSVVHSSHLSTIAISDSRRRYTLDLFLVYIIAYSALIISYFLISVETLYRRSLVATSYLGLFPYALTTINCSEWGRVCPPVSPSDGDSGGVQGCLTRIW